jgi:hypothetical protein
MIKALAALVICIPLVSFGAMPATPTVYWTRIAVQRGAPAVQACTWETAPARLQQQIADPIGYPFGQVSAWSCSGDTQAVIAELETRAGAMQAEAAAYREKHPIAGNPTAP